MSIHDTVIISMHWNVMIEIKQEAEKYIVCILYKKEGEKNILPKETMKD